MITATYWRDTAICATCNSICLRAQAYETMPNAKQAIPAMVCQFDKPNNAFLCGIIAPIFKKRFPAALPIMTKVSAKNPIARGVANESILISAICLRRELSLAFNYSAKFPRIAVAQGNVARTEIDFRRIGQPLLDLAF